MKLKRILLTKKCILLIVSSFLFVALLLILIVPDERSASPILIEEDLSSTSSVILRPYKRLEGYQKAYQRSLLIRPAAFSDGKSFPWSNTMLSWQRTNYHFQSEQNWMNDQ